LEGQGRGKGKDSVGVYNGVIRTFGEHCKVGNQNKLVLLDFHWCSWYFGRGRTKNPHLNRDLSSEQIVREVWRNNLKI